MAPPGVRPPPTVTAPLSQPQQPPRGAFCSSPNSAFTPVVPTGGQPWISKSFYQKNLVKWRDIVSQETCNLVIPQFDNFLHVHSWFPECMLSIDYHVFQNCFYVLRKVYIWMWFCSVRTGINNRYVLKFALYILIGDTLYLDWWHDLVYGIFYRYLFNSLFLRPALKKDWKILNHISQVGANHTNCNWLNCEDFISLIFKHCLVNSLFYHVYYVQFWKVLPNI